MVDLNDLAVFQKVAAFHSFSAAARMLGLPKSSVSRAIARLEADLGNRLFQRSTRTVQLTLIGQALADRCAGGLAEIDEAISFVASMTGTPRGLLRISAGIGFGINVLGPQLPDFLARYPEIQISVDLTSRDADLFADEVDVAIRMGPLADSTLVATRLGSMKRYLCAAPGYVARHGHPSSVRDLAGHATIEMPGRDGRRRVWSFTRDGETERIDIQPRVSINEALLIARLVQDGAGIGIISGYVCAPALEAGELVVLLPEWTPPPVEVSLVFPSRREMSQTIRAFVDYMRESNRPDAFWTKDPDAHGLPG